MEFTPAGATNTISTINIVTSLPSSPSVGDVVLLREGDELNLWYYTGGTETYNATPMLDLNRKINSNIQGLSDPTTSYNRNIASVTDDNYLYAMYFTISSSSYTFDVRSPSGSVALRRWSLSTGLEDNNFKKKIILSSSQNSIQGLGIKNNTLYTSFNGTNVLFSISLTATSFTTEGAFAPSGIHSIDKIFSYNNDLYYILRVTSGGFRSLYVNRGFDENRRSLLSSGIPSSQVSSYQWVRDSNYFWAFNTASTTMRANSSLAWNATVNNPIQQTNRVTEREFEPPLKTVTDNNTSQLLAPSLHNNYLYYLTLGISVTNPGDFLALKFKGGNFGWQRVDEGITLPDSTVSLQGSGPPNSLLGVEGHFYWDNTGHQLYIKEGTWQKAGIGTDSQITVGNLCGKKMDGTDKILTSSEFTALTSKPTGTIFCVEVPQ